MNYLNLINPLFFKIRRLPLYLIFFVTNKCNAKCLHCFYRIDHSKKQPELTLDEIRKISRTMKPLWYVNLTGGEPFLRDDLPQIAEVFYKNCSTRSFGIATNGSQPEKILRDTKEIIRICPDASLEIAVSIDHFEKEHDRIRAFPGLFRKATETIELLKKLDAKNLVVSVNLTLTAENEKEIENIYRFIRDSIKPQLIMPLYVRGDISESIKKVSSQSYENLINSWADDIKNKRFEANQNYSLGWLVTKRDIRVRKMILDTIRGRDVRLRCLAAVVGAVLYEDGTISPCELLSDTLGNIRDYGYDFRKIWFSNKARAIAEKIKNQKCWCTHECFLGLNVLFNVKGLFSVLKQASLVDKK